MSKLYISENNPKTMFSDKNKSENNGFFVHSVITFFDESTIL